MSTDMLGEESALAQVAGPFRTFWERLAGPEGLVWLAAFKRFLRKENPWAIYAIWRTVLTGGKSKEQLLEELQAVNSQVTNWGQQMMAHQSFVTAPTSSRVDFIRVRVSNLGFTDLSHLPTTAQIWERADSLGLDRCLPDDGPNLRLDYQDQPLGEVIWLAMDQIPDAGGYLSVFRLGRNDGGLWLNGDCAPPDGQWGLDNVLVVRKRP